MSLLNKKHEKRPSIEEVIRVDIVRQALFGLINESCLNDPEGFAAIRRGLVDQDSAFAEEIQTYMDIKI